MRVSRSDFLKMIGGVGVVSRLVGSDTDARRKFRDIELAAAGRVDVVDGLLYDRVRVRPGESLQAVRPFSIPIGHPDAFGNIRTPADTNMHCSQQLPPPSSFLVRRVGFLVDGRAPAADLSRVAWYLYLDQKFFAHGPMAWSTGIGQLRVTMGESWSIADKAELTLPKRTDALFRNVSALGGIHILTMQCFGVTFEGEFVNDSDQDVSFYVVLAGLEWRGVQ